MYNTTEQCQAVLSRSSRKFAAFFVPENDTTEYREIKSIKISAMSSSDGQITIGDTSSKSIQIIATVDSMLVEGQKIYVYESVKLDDETYQDIPMGKYTITALTEKGGITTIEGKGPLSVEAYTPYFSELTYPSDTISMLNEISILIGVTINTDNLTPITFENKPEGYICREMIGYIAALYGKNAVEERDGSISLKWYEHQDTDIFSDKIDLPEIKKSDFVVNKLQCNVSSEVSYTKGSGTGIIISNPFMTEDIMENVWLQLQGYTYRPAEINVKSGNPCIDQWDSYSYGIYNIICARIEHKYDGGVQNTITSSGESEAEANVSFKGPTAIVLERYAAEMVLVNEALVHKLSADEADIKYIKSSELTTVEANIKNAVIGSLSAEFATVNYLETNYAQINLANVEKSTIGTVLADVGLITEATIKNGHVTGYLDSVEVNANSITAGTLVTDRLVFRGQEKSIVYELNNITGALQAVQSDTLNGEILTDRSITVDKIVAKSITANEIAAATISVNELNVSNIFGDEAVLNKITASSIFSNAVAANSVVVGASNNAINALNAVNGMEIGGRNILLNGSFKANYEKWELQTNGETAELTAKYNKKCAHIKSTALKCNGLFKQSIIGKLEPNTKYTMSGWTLTENITKGSTNFVIMFYQDGYYPVNNKSTWFGYGSKNFTINSGVGAWNYVSWTFVTDSKVESATYLNIYVYTRDFIGDVYFYDLKLEKGNKATDWSPAPEDISIENIYKENTTLIDGGKIYTGTVTTNAIAANAVTADKLSVSSLSAITANLGTVKIGGSNNGNGILEIYNASNQLMIKGDNTGLATTKMINIDDNSQSIVFNNTAYVYGGATYTISGIDIGGLTLGKGEYLEDEDGGYIGGVSKIFAGNSFDIKMGYSRYNVKSILRGYYGQAGSDGIEPVKAQFYGDVEGETINCGKHLSVGYDNTSYALSAASFICNSWVRTVGSTGWYNETYGGGWYMADTTWIRNYGSKKTYLNALLRVDANIQFGSTGAYYVNSNGEGRMNRLVLLNANDASPTANNSPALIIGGSETAQHIEIDGNEIISKNNATTKGSLYLNDCFVFEGNTFRATGTSHSLGSSAYRWIYLYVTECNARQIELFHSTPYIDFHYNNSTVDYTARIIEASSGALKVYNTIANASDRRLKKDIEGLPEKYLDVLDNLRPSQYRYIKGDRYLSLGFVAQDVLEALKEAGITDIPLVSQDSSNGMYSLDYNGIIPILVLAVQKLRKEVNDLKAIMAG